MEREPVGTWVILVTGRLVPEFCGHRRRPQPLPALECPYLTGSILVPAALGDVSCCPFTISTEGLWALPGGGPME